MSAATLFATELRQLATSTIKIRSRSSRNIYSENVYTGSQTSYKAYIQTVTGAILNLEENEFIIEYKAYIPSTTLTVAMSDEVEFPDGTIRQIIKVDNRGDEYGTQCVVLSFGRLRM
jgi:hypothetical protein